MQTLQKNFRLPEFAPRLGIPAIMPGLVACIAPAAGAQGMSCGELAALSLPNTTITSAAAVPAGPFSAVPIGDPYAAEGQRALRRLARPTSLPPNSQPSAG